MNSTPTDSHDAAYHAGLDCLRRIEGSAQPALVDALADIAPDLATLTIGFVYGRLYTRGHLTLRQRQLVTVAALAALGHARPQLKFHLAGALNVGCSSGELVELMLHLALYAGFPAALNGVFAAQEVFRERGIAHRPAATSPDATATRDDRYRAGWQALQRIDGHAGEQVIDALRDLAPDLGRLIVEFGFGDLYGRPGLALLERELVTVAALAAMGTASPQLKVHLHGLINVGGTREQVVETLIQLAAYAGFPAALNALAVAREVLAERDAA